MTPAMLSVKCHLGKPGLGRGKRDSPNDDALNGRKVKVVKRKTVNKGGV